MSDDRTPTSEVDLLVDQTPEPEPDEQAARKSRNEVRRELQRLNRLLDTRRGKGRWTPAARKRQSLALQRYWDQRRKNPMDPEPTEEPQQPSQKPVTAGQSAYLQRRALPAQLKSELEALQENIRTSVIADMGGESEIPAVKMRLIDNFIVMEVVKQLMLHDIQQWGTHTIKGRVRSSMDALFKAVDRQNQVGKTLGLTRVTKKVEESIADWIAGQTVTREGASASGRVPEAPAEEASAPDASDDSQPA